ncbi:hypothetical protein CC79DRAFT_526812 [Sarocladium strictum]
MPLTDKPRSMVRSTPKTRMGACSQDAHSDTAGDPHDLTASRTTSPDLRLTLVTSLSWITARSKVPSADTTPLSPPLLL